MIEASVPSPQAAICEGLKSDAVSSKGPRKFQHELRAALMQVFALLAQGRIQAQVARRLPQGLTHENL